MWWCPKCKEEVPSNMVTFNETHDICGYLVLDHNPNEEVVKLQIRLDLAEKAAKLNLISADNMKAAWHSACEDISKLQDRLSRAKKVVEKVSWYIAGSGVEVNDTSRTVQILASSVAFFELRDCLRDYYIDREFL